MDLQRLADEILAFFYEVWGRGFCDFVLRAGISKEQDC